LSLTAFEQRLGVSQARIQNASGDYVFVLGDAVEGYLANFTVGDAVTIEQSVDVTALQIIRLGEGLLRTPGDVVAESVTWQVDATINGAAVMSTLGYPGTTRALTNIAWDVHALVGVQTIGIRLLLVVG